MEWTSDNTDSVDRVMPFPRTSISLPHKYARDWRLPHSDSGQRLTHSDSGQKLPLSDSGQNSLEYWDYSVELEMLNGPEDLQLAAELGKTLLERNRELETNIKHQQAIIDDQSQEIEYLSKQTAALREVNDSRLRIYEQLEISIHDLEKGNQRLNAEGLADKKKIKSLTGTIEQLELKVVELQKSLEEAKTLQEAKSAEEKELNRGRTNKRRSFILQEEQLSRRSQSCENTTQTSNHAVSSGDEAELSEKVERLELALKELQYQRGIDLRRKEELEIEVSCLTQETNMLMTQLSIVQTRDDYNTKSLDEELASMDETSSSKVCRKCLGMVDETESNNTMQDFTDDLDDFETSFESIHGERALIKMKNGGYAYGSRESMASLGQIMNGEAPCGQPTITAEAREAPRNSILSELDTQYRILIEKYESLIEVRQQQQMENQQRMEEENGQTIVDSGVDEISGPMSTIVLSKKASEMSQSNPIISTLKCQRCTTCSCDIKSTNQRPKSNSEFSEVETNSSGFSEGEGRLYSRGTQTCQDHDFIVVPGATSPSTQLAKCLELPAALDPFEHRFQTTPEYKQLFHEIFTVLKKNVDENELSGVHEKIMDSLKNSMNKDDFIESLNLERTNSSESVKLEQNDENKVTVHTDQQLSENHEPHKSQDSQSEKKREKKKKKKSQKCEQINSVDISSRATMLERPKTPDLVEKMLKTPDLVEKMPKQSDLVEKMLKTPDLVEEIPKRLNLLEMRSDSVENTPKSTNSLENRPKRPDSLEICNLSRSSSRQSRRRRRNKENKRTIESTERSVEQCTKSVDTSAGTHTTQTKPHRPSSASVTRTLEFTGTKKESTRGFAPKDSACSQVRCEHKQKKHKSKTNKHTAIVWQEKLQEMDRKMQQNPQYYNPYSVWTRNSYQNPPPKISHPSVEVAKLRQLEMTYAQVLKSTFSKTQYERRY